MRHFHRHSIRLKGYDYSTTGYYFVTICTQDRIHVFGNISKSVSVGADPCVRPGMMQGPCVRPGMMQGPCVCVPTMQYDPAGLMIQSWWKKLEQNFSHVVLDTYVIMPNHIHGIIQIHQGGNTKENRGGHINQNKGGHMGPPLQKIIQWYKTMTTNEYIRRVKMGQYVPFHKRLWQRDYWERIIRTESEYRNVRTYIQDNVKNWEKDGLF